VRRGRPLAEAPARGRGQAGREVSPHEAVRLQVPVCECVRDLDLPFAKNFERKLNDPAYKSDAIIVQVLEKVYRLRRQRRRRLRSDASWNKPRVYLLGQKRVTHRDAGRPIAQKRDCGVEQGERQIGRE
jgi:hypothetical protein